MKGCIADSNTFLTESFRDAQYSRADQAKCNCQHQDDFRRVHSANTFEATNRMNVFASFGHKMRREYAQQNKHLKSTGRHVAMD